jgi:hypothetical protein
VKRVDQQRRGNGCAVREGHKTRNYRGQTDPTQCPWVDDVQKVQVYDRTYRSTLIQTGSLTESQVNKVLELLE